MNRRQFLALAAAAPVAAALPAISAPVDTIRSTRLYQVVAVGDGCSASIYGHFETLGEAIRCCLGAFPDNQFHTLSWSLPAPVEPA